MVNRVTSDYVSRCATDPDLRTAVTRAELLPAYRAAYGHNQLSRPIFADEAQITAFGDDLAGLCRLLVSLPERFFDGDLRRYASAAGIDPQVADLMCRDTSTPPLGYARADAFHDGASFRVLELNYGSELGGTDAAEVNRAFLGVDSFRAFAEEHRLGFLDTGEHLAEILRQAALPATGGGREPVAALLEATGGVEEYRRVFEAIRDSTRRHGIELLIGEIGELTERGGKLHLRGQPLDVILRMFLPMQLLGERDPHAAADLLVRAHLEGKTMLTVPLSDSLFNAKGALALLHQPDIHASLTTAERDLVDRVLPWTRHLGDGSDADLFDLCRERREGLVLKPSVGLGGIGTLIGAEHTDAAWQEALAAAKGMGYVAQERVRPELEPVLDHETGELGHWAANWGVFVTRDGYAGAFVRALEPEHGTVISYGNKRTRGTGVFTFPADPPVT